MIILIIIHNKNRKEKVAKDSKEEMEYYKVLMNKMKIQTDELKDKFNELSTKNESLIEDVKNRDEKINHSKYNMSSLKKSLQEKELEFNKLLEKLAHLENFSTDKEKIDKRISELQRNNDNLKRELEYYSNILINYNIT